MEENVKKSEVAANNAPEQPSYEQLKYWLDKAISDNKNLVAQLNEVSNILNFLPWLFKAIELKNEFTPEFIERCKTGIESILTPVKKTEEKKED